MIISIILIIAAPLAILVLPAPYGYSFAAFVVVFLSYREWQKARVSEREEKKAQEEAAAAKRDFRDSFSDFVRLQAGTKRVERSASDADINDPAPS